MAKMSNEEFKFEIEFASTVPKADRDRLEAAMRLHANAEAAPHDRAEPVTIILVTLKIATAVGGAVATWVRVAREIKQWREESQKRNIPPEARLKRRDEKDLLLANASDEDIDRWLQP